MDIFKKSGSARELVRAIAKMQPITYTQPTTELQRIHKRLMMGRAEFQKVMSTIFAASVGVNTLDLRVNHTVEEIKNASGRLKDATENIQGVTSGTTLTAQEVSDAHEGLNNIVVDLSDTSQNILRKIKAEQTELEGIKALSEETAQHSGQVKQDIEALTGMIGHMEEMIADVSAIASQTNVLALNSSIEAVKSGEAGRGYALVAEQIRQLSEKAGELTGSMNELVTGMRSASEQCIRNAEAVDTSLASISEKLDAMQENAQDNRDGIAQIGFDLASVAAAGEEICASFLEVEDQIHAIDKECQKIYTEAEQMHEVSNGLEETTRPFESLEKLFDHATRRMGKMAEDPFYMPDNQIFMNFVRSAVTDHEKWLETLKEIVTEQKILPLQTDDTRCAFGCFYSAVTPKNTEIRQIWDVIGSKHHDLHGAAKNAIQAVEQEDAETAVQEYDRAKNILEELCQCYQQVLNIAETLDKAQVRILEQSSISA